MQQARRGNILFLILLAVVLFAALSYAVTSSMRGGGKTATSETVQARAAQYLQYTSLLENTVTRMLLNGVRETEISFSNSVYRQADDVTYNCWNDNPSCTSAACKIFDKDGGGVTPLTFEKISYTPASWAASAASIVKPGHITVRQGIIAGVGTTAPDLILIVAGIDPETCNEINRGFGIVTNFNGTSSPVEPVATSRPDVFAGCAQQPSYNSTKVFGDEDTRFNGQRTFCAPMDNTNGSLYLVQVLIAR